MKAAFEKATRETDCSGMLEFFFVKPQTPQAQSVGWPSVLLTFKAKMKQFVNRNLWSLLQSCLFAYFTFDYKQF